MAPTLLHLLGVEVPADLDGRPLTETLLSPGLERRVVAPSEPEAEPSPYSAAERAVVSGRLRGLGYRE